MRYPSLVRTTILPLCLILTCPVTVVLIWYTQMAYAGSLARALASIDIATVYNIWPRPTLVACQILLIFVLMQLLLMVLLPGRTYLGPVTPAGDRVAYKINGLQAWVVTHLLLYLGAYQLKWFSPTIVYDHFGSLLTVCSLFSLLFCGFLYAKGVWMPSGKDAGRSGNFIFDYFWGVELHPRILGIDLKQFANVHLGMMCWSVIILSFLAKQYAIYHHVSNSMLLSVSLQLVYIFKFFWWERGYYRTLDMMHDRFGFYLCWGIITWLPCLYTSQALYLVHHPNELGTGPVSFILILGLVAIYINYDADIQRTRVREANGACTIWGKRPEVIVAKYTSADGRMQENLLLVSGWWGLSRHFHYLAEIMIALSWTLPCLFDHFLPYFYVAFLTILLVHRSFRDDRRCREKYGSFWDNYCARVPYRVIPHIF